MEIAISVENGTDMTVIENRYPDLYLDDIDSDGYATYFIGDSSEDRYLQKCYGTLEDEEELYTKKDALMLYGFVMALLPDAIVCFEGCGPWAMGEYKKEEAYRIGYEKGKSRRVEA
uniref:Uncharacterized protein n=1 Tax=Candidatus Kentrum sp. UNK TaxID=2126344 RepID=A0A450ZWP7_9GAMM|nr:MAG: hypothetical protein BECKUNK1418G_GA0071005_100255 [Candidatus Kentron sp. UNK]VFK68326.1 MAG: hypothetical protein BECKUNK1418H_GA0071006_100155 [Candidatus Kentron sp. UNK]